MDAGAVGSLFIQSAAWHSSVNLLKAALPMGIPRPFSCPGDSGSHVINNWD